MKTVLITGASAGSGAAAARLFAANGYRVLLLARSADALVALARDIGPAAHDVPCDAADPAAVALAAEQIETAHGTPDVILHCAGAGTWKPLPDTSPAEAATMMGAPYFAAYNITHAFLPGMLARGSGVLVAMNSPAGIFQWPNATAYSAARGALRAFQLALAQDLHGTGVHAVHAVFGLIRSEYFDTNRIDPRTFPRVFRTVPPISTDRVARALLDLAENPRVEALFPARVALLCGAARLLPGVARWLLRQ